MHVDNDFVYKNVPRSSKLAFTYQVEERHLRPPDREQDQATEELKLKKSPRRSAADYYKNADGG